MAKRACVLLADGFEEIEAVTIIDVLRRAGVHVSVLGVRGLDVRGAHGLRLHADGLLRDVEDTREVWDAVILPGGSENAQTLHDDPDAQAFIRSQGQHDDVILAAICAGPIALAQAGLLRNRQATCYPGFEEQLEGARLSTDAVVVDGRIITSRGPGTALLFALRLVQELTDNEKADNVRDGLLLSSESAAML